jgi:NAD(P)-dependent dehydrogenase (short-subunit alcohol dehydrogenase family)
MCAIDNLTNETGVMMCPFELTKAGFENQFHSNHLSHFLLTLLLTPQLKASSAGRVVNVSSEGHALAPQGTSEAAIASVHDAKTYRPDTACKCVVLNPVVFIVLTFVSFFTDGVSKLANIQFSYELNRRYGVAGLPITAYSLHPGGVDSELARHMPPLVQVLQPRTSPALSH